MRIVVIVQPVSQTAIGSSGLSFEFTEEQELFRRTLRELVDAEFSKDYCREVEAREIPFRSIFLALAKAAKRSPCT